MTYQFSFWLENGLIISLHLQCKEIHYYGRNQAY